MGSSDLLSFAHHFPSLWCFRGEWGQGVSLQNVMAHLESPAAGTHGEGNRKGRMKQRKTSLIRAHSRWGWLGCFRAECCCISGVGRQWEGSCRSAASRRGAPHSHLLLPALSLPGFPPAWQPAPHKAQSSTPQASPCPGGDALSFPEAWDSGERLTQRPG